MELELDLNRVLSLVRDTNSYLTIGTRIAPATLKASLEFLLCWLNDEARCMVNEYRKEVMIRRRGFSSFFSSTTTRTKTSSSGPPDSAKKSNIIQKFWLRHIFLLIGAVACYLLLRYQSSALYHTGNESSNPRRHPRPSKEILPQLPNDEQEAIKILYCHIGKTGGEFVKSQLGSVMCKARQNPKLKEECLRKQHEPHSTTRLSNHTIAYTHVGRWIPQNGLGMASHMLFSVRHPVDRFVSWYFYNHPANCDLRDNNSPSCRSQQALSENNPSSFATRFYQNCFPVIGNLFITLKESDIDSKCFQLAKETFQLQLDQRDLNHLFWNYKVSYAHMFIYLGSFKMTLFDLTFLLSP